MACRLSEDRSVSIVTPGLVKDLRRISPLGVHTDVSLRGLSRWKIGGQAALIVRPETQDQVVRIRRYFSRYTVPHVVVGMTTNLLFDDLGLLVPCIQIGSRLGRFKYIDRDECFLVEAGMWVPSLAKKIMHHSYSGAEHICGIPGTIGGLIAMNGGSQRKAIGEAVVAVRSVDQDGVVIDRNGKDCEFEYRKSIYQRRDEIILDAKLKFLKVGSNVEVRRNMLTILSDRRNKFPQKHPNCGSVFKSDPAMYKVIGPPGRVIESLGFKGEAVGGAAVSEQHANFIVNVSGATADDVLAIISKIYSLVLSQTGYKMAIEAKFVTKMGAVLDIESMIKP